MQDPIQGPAEQWTLHKDDLRVANELLASNDELDRAYGEAYRNRCFIREFQGITCVGDLDLIALIELRTGKEIDVYEIAAGQLVELAHPGDGNTRAARVLDGMRKVIEARTASPAV